MFYIKCYYLEKQWYNLYITQVKYHPYLSQVKEALLSFFWSQTDKC